MAAIQGNPAYPFGLTQSGHQGISIADTVI